MNKTFSASQPKGRVLCTEKKKKTLFFCQLHMGTWFKTQTKPSQIAKYIMVLAMADTNFLGCALY